jgi:hypothetical protein
VATNRSKISKAEKVNPAPSADDNGDDPARRFRQCTSRWRNSRKWHGAANAFVLIRA